jgi:membrane protease YdiL (CAAX protease family)
MPIKPRTSAMLALLLIAPAPTIGVLGAMVVFSQTPLGQGVYFGAKIWLLGLPLVWHLFVDRQRPSLSPARKGGFGMGALLGLAISAMIFAAYFVVGRGLIDPAELRSEAAENGIGTPARYLAFSAYLIFVNSVLEEYVYRWFVFRKCEVLMSAVPAVLVAAGIFTVHHVIALAAQVPLSITILGSAGVFIGGAIWSWMYLRYRSVWPGYLSHAIVDVAILVIGWHIIFGAGAAAAAAGGAG